MQGKYTVRGMHFHAFHGLLEVERELGLVFSVDATLFFPLSPTDESQTAMSEASSAEIYEVTKSVMTGTKYQSRVSLALRIAHELLKRFGKVSEAHVAVTRKQIFVPGFVDTIEAEVQCKREDFPV